MTEYIKTHVKNFNAEVLGEQVRSGLPESRLLWAGFHSTNRLTSRYVPNSETKVISSQSQPDGSTVEITAEPGEMKWNFREDLTAQQEATLDSILTAHNADDKSVGQRRIQQNQDASNAFRDNFNDWGTLTLQQKDNNAKQITRFMARLLDQSTDI